MAAAKIPPSVPPPSHTREAGAEKPQLPYSDRGLVACRICHLVLTREQFMSEGCRNCTPGEEMGREEVDQSTTLKFSGFVGLVDAPKSWVARLIGCKNAPSGVYAAHVTDDRAAGSDSDEDADGEDVPA